MGALKLRPEVADTEGWERVARPQDTTRTLTGHSGAHVVLHTRGSESFVRKTAASVAANARLRAQAGKQHKLWMMGTPVPKILREGEDEAGRASFDMTYIPGQSLANAVIQAGSLDSGRVVKAVERLIWLFLLERGAVIPKRHFHDKIDEIVNLCRGRFARPLLDAIDSNAERLAEKDWAGIPESPCHGDLSLDNILLTAGKSVAFIDCDNPWVSSFWLDFGKLFQDIYGHWCIRTLCIDSRPAERVNACQKLEQLREPFLALASNIDATLPARLPQLAALCLFRIIPYASDPVVISFLCHRIHRVLEN